VLGDQREVSALVGDRPGRRYRFSTTRTDGMAAFVRDGMLTLAIDGVEEPLLPREAVPLLGGHNVANALAAALTARLAGVEASVVAAGLASARALPHRMEPVGTRDGVLWVNDSKATNVAATVSGVVSADRPLVLLLGGTDKGEDLAPLASVLPGPVRAVVCYGAAGPRFAAALSRVDGLRVIEAADFAGAVARGTEVARPGDVLLLSPAASSFDEFVNYEARGLKFGALARGEAA
jgi:UDP-N-acetylmuramoylalanine--D-glutamate ligase